MNLYIYNYNNYYNRLVMKAGNSIEDYEPWLYYGPVQGVAGFTPGDDVDTVQVIGSPALTYDGKGDYLIVHDPFTNEINSRWFIIDSVRTRSGQYELTLHRDLIADFYESIIDFPMFIEKASLDANNPLLFNEEAMTVNQIKKSETLLKDRTGCKWLVGYYARQTSEPLSGTVQTTDNFDKPYIQINTQLESYEYYKYSTEGNLFYSNPREGYFIINAKTAGYGTVSYKTNIRSITGYTQASSKSGSTNYYTDKYLEEACTALQQAYGRTAIPRFNILLRDFIDFATYEEQDEFLNLNGKTLRDADGNYYTVSVIQEGTNVERTIDLSQGSLKVEMENYATQAGFKGETKNDTFQAQLFCDTYKLQFTLNTQLSTTYSIPTTNVITEDAPWNIFAIPYGKGLTIKSSNDTTVLQLNDENIGLQIAASMQKNHPGIIYDIQVLPYFPLQDLITDVGEITLQSEKQYSFVKDGNQNNISIIFSLDRSKFTFDLTDYVIESGVTNIEKKMNNECDKWRLSSPNYSSYFDFSVEKNGGIQYFNVDCEYKPFTPYIHINPNFSNLYGYDDNSPRGLVLGGDYSISQIIDQWEQYQIQNKNFQNIFDRQIQNMEISQKYQRLQEMIGLGAGSLTGAASGALAGSAIMPGIGTAIGAGAGAVASLIGGIGDIAISDKLRSEAIDYTKDQFGYQLGNIRALPETISKVSAINNNNKGFPILEYYTCTEEEKIAFLNKIAYNGMTTMIIGKISDFLNNGGKGWELKGIKDQGYIKGQLIRAHGLNIDYHVINAISGELSKGAYF